MNRRGEFSTMSLSIGSLSQSAALQSTSIVAGAVMVKSLDVERQTGAEAVGLIETAAQVGSTSQGQLSVYA
jgi:hypothetical protein